MPTVDETGNKIAPYSGVQGIHVLKVAAERKHDAIAKVLQVLTNDSVGIAMAKASGCAPAKQSCYDDPVISGDDMVMAMYDTAQDAVPMPNVPENGRYVDGYGKSACGCKHERKKMSAAAHRPPSSRQRALSSRCSDAERPHYEE